MELPLGDGTVEVALPDCEVTVAEPRGADPVDVPVAARHALDEPLGPPLSEVVDAGDEVAIAVTDVTRATPDDVLLDALVERLAAVGVDRDDVTVVVGLGLHRPLSDAEIEREYGEHADLVVNHDPDATVAVGTVDEVPVEVHPAIGSADVVCATGVVEPHQYAGFSGGAKTVAVGAGGEPLIRHTHGPALLGEHGVRLGRVEDNPFREFVDRAGDVAGPDFCLNVTYGRVRTDAGSEAADRTAADRQSGADGGSEADGGAEADGRSEPAARSGILGVRAGRPRRVVRELAAVAREAMAVPVDREYDAVVAGVGAPKDASLYQASRAATYVALGDRSPLAPDGRIVVPARLQEGAGEGTGERRFYEWLAGGESPAAVYDAMREGYEPGAQRAFVLARVLRDHDVYVTNSEAPDVVEDCHMHAPPSVEDAIEPESDVLVVPDAIGTLLVEPTRAAGSSVDRGSGVDRESPAGGGTGADGDTNR